MKLPMEDSQIKKDLLNAVVFEHTCRPLNPNAKSTAFRSSSARYHFNNVYRSIAHEYLINTFNKPHDPEMESTLEDYCDDAGITMLSINDKHGETYCRKISLPSSLPLEKSLSDVIKNRRSIRYYSGGSTHITKISTMLGEGYGISYEAQINIRGEESIRIPMRTVASAGALYPLDVYLLANNIDEVPQGIYRYDVEQHRLIESAPEKSFKKILAAYKVPHPQLRIDRCSGIILLAARPWKTLRKFGDRGLRYIFHEAGAVAQNIHLVANALNVGAVDCAKFYEADVHKPLGMDGKNIMLIHSIIFGDPDCKKIGGKK